jgi:hypothetical protein
LPSGPAPDPDPDPDPADEAVPGGVAVSNESSSSPRFRLEEDEEEAWLDSSLCGVRHENIG